MHSLQSFAIIRNAIDLSKCYSYTKLIIDAYFPKTG